MQISFPPETPQYSGRDLVLTFPAVVDDTYVECTITAEALEDHFGAASPREEDLVRAFDANRPAIERAARTLLGELGAKPVLLHSGYFRFYESQG